MKEAKQEAERIKNIFASSISGNFSVGQITENANKCAILHIKGIIQTHREQYYNSFGQAVNSRTIRYWQQVLKEAESN